MAGPSRPSTLFLIPTLTAKVMNRAGAAIWRQLTVPSPLPPPRSCRIAPRHGMCHAVRFLLGRLGAAIEWRHRLCFFLRKFLPRRPPNNTNDPPIVSSMATMDAMMGPRFHGDCLSHSCSLPQSRAPFEISQSLSSLISLFTFLLIARTH